MVERPIETHPLIMGEQPKDDLRAVLGETHPEVPSSDVGQRTCRAGKTRLGVDEIPDLAPQVGNIAGIPEQLGCAL